MELLNVEDVVSITLFDLRISENELQYIADALHYLLVTLDVDHLKKVFNDETHQSPEETYDIREFAEGIYQEAMNFIKLYCREESLEKRFKEWEIKYDSSENDDQ